MKHKSLISTKQFLEGMDRVGEKNYADIKKHVNKNLQKSLDLLTEEQKQKG